MHAKLTSHADINQFKLHLIETQFVTHVQGVRKLTESLISYKVIKDGSQNNDVKNNVLEKKSKGGGDHDRNGNANQMPA